MEGAEANSKLSTPSVALLLVPPVSGGQLASAVFTVVTDSTPETGVVPRRGEGVDKSLTAHSSPLQGD